MAGQLAGPAGSAADDPASFNSHKTANQKISIDAGPRINPVSNGLATAKPGPYLAS
jgi:hypothetical protein